MSLLLCTALLPALAQDPAEGGLPEGEFYGHDQLWATRTSDFAVDAEGASGGQDLGLAHRLRLGLRYPIKGWELDTEWDLLAGQLAGDTWDIDGDLDERHREQLSAWTTAGHYARKASIRGQPWGVDTQLGLQTSHWGLGMVANDGDHPVVFGRTDFGDRVLRARATAAPFHAVVPLYFTVAADRVVADDVARWSRDQAAWQGIFSVLWRREATVGVYIVRRRQAEKTDDRLTKAWVFDVYGDGNLDVGTWDLRLAGEAAGILGSTTRTLAYGDTDPMRIASAGATGLAQLTGPKEQTRLTLRAGWASVDRNADDDQLNDFTFDRDFDVGMVLFDQVTGAIEAAASDQLTDPSNVGKAPDGIDGLTTEGAFRRGTFLQPSVSWRPVDWFEVRGGVTLAWTPVGWQQPFYTARAGGVPTDHHGQTADAGLLGTELDVAVQLWGAPRSFQGQPVRLSGGVQGATLFLGPALAGAGPDRVDHGMAWARLDF